MSQDDDVSALSDDELGHELRDRFGYKAGPITATTRSVYEKKLSNLRKNPPAAKITPSKRPQNGDHTERAGLFLPLSYAPCFDPFLCPSIAVQIEASPLRRGRKSLPLPSPSQSPSRLDTFTPSLPTIRDAPSTPISPSSRRSSRRVTLAASPPKSHRIVHRPKSLSTYSSDEDEVGDEAFGNEAGGSLRLGNGAADAPVLQTVSSAAKPKPKSRMSTHSSFPLASRHVLNRSPGRAGRMSTPFDSTAMPSLSGFSDSEVENEEEFATRPSPGSSGNSLRSRKRASVRVPRAPDDVATRSSENDKDVTAGGLLSSSYNWVSCSILAVSIAFFLSVFFYYFINSAYFSEFKSSPTVSPVPYAQSSSDPFADLIAKLKAPLCGEVLTASRTGPCLSSRSDIPPALLVIQHIRHLFEDKLLRHFCSPAETSDDNFSDDPEVLTLAEIRSKVGPQLMSSKKLEEHYQHHAVVSDDGGDFSSGRVSLFHKAVQDAIALIRLNPEFRIQPVFVDNEVTALRVNAGNFPVTWPIGCRVRMGLTNAFWTMTIVASIILITIIIYHLFASQKERKNQQQRLFLELLEKSLELLQSPDEPGSMPVLHIRDTLISPSERKDQHLMRVWEQVVRHIEAEESRVKVDMEEIEGETFKTWKWLCSPLSAESAAGSLMTGSIEWQGQAFNERDGAAAAISKPARTAETREVDFEAPTAFLKVRNMFDEETVATANSKNDSYWKTKIRNAIIEKCAILAADGRHGMCHIFVDERNAKEGLVYVKCVDQRSATAAYRALHGWWCEKRLVSVRFLKDERYFSRFPEARSARTELPLEAVVDED